MTYLPLTSATLGDAFPNTVEGDVPITLESSALSDVEFSFVWEVSNMVDILSVVVDYTLG